MTKKTPLKGIAEKLIFVAVIFAAWEIVARAHVFGARSEIIFPRLETIARAFVKNFVMGYAGVSLWVYLFNSMKLLLEGMAIGILLAFLFSGLCMVSHGFHNVYSLVVAVANAFMVLTAAEMIGATSGLGYFVRYYADFADYTRVIAGIIIIGLVVQYGILNPIEKHTVVKWGMRKL